MKIALVTTTIFVPRVLSLFRRLGPDVAMYVAGDRKTPHDEVRAFLGSLGGTVEYYSDTDQQALGYACSDVIGWDTIPRRNLALLEALASDAEIFVTIDDDNIPLGTSYFDDLRELFQTTRPALVASSDAGWFNPGEFLSPPIFVRGFPHELRERKLPLVFGPAEEIRVGIATGMILGDPDVDAVDRISQRPRVDSVSEVFESGVVTANGCFSPVNSQNTAACRELAPLLMVLPGIGRHQDIWASFIAQRIMMETDHRIHFGKPFVWQQRTPQSPWQNLREELLGMEIGARFVEDLRRIDLSRDTTLLGRLSRVFSAMGELDYVPEQTLRFAHAWCADLTRILP